MEITYYSTTGNPKMLPLLLCSLHIITIPENQISAKLDLAHDRNPIKECRLKFENFAFEQRHLPELRDLQQQIQEETRRDPESVAFVQRSIMLRR